MNSQLDALFARVGGVRNVLIALAGLALAGGVLWVSRVASSPAMVAAETGIDIESASALGERLKQAGIPFDLANGGRDILVAEPDLARARVAINKDGKPGASGGWNIFDKNTGIASDFVTRTNFRRAMEGELARTIGEMRGVRSARVSIAMPEQAAFRRTDDRPVTASVVMTLAAGTTVKPETVQGITHLIASSVGSMSPEDVSVLDETGRLLTEPRDRGEFGASNRQLRLQQETESYLSAKATRLVEQFVGPGNAQVTVNAAMNFTKVDRTVQSVDPEKAALSTEQKAEIIPGAQGGAGSTNVANAYENSKSTEVVQGAVGTVSRLSVAVLVADKRLPSAAGDSVPRFAKRTPEELAQLTTLVRDAVGIDSTRGDRLTVESTTFETPVAIGDVPVARGDLLASVQRWQRPGVSVLGLVFAFVLAFMALKSLKSAPVYASAPPALASGQMAMSAAIGAGAGAMQPQVAAPQPFILPSAVPGVRDQVAASVERDPDAAARVLKSWIAEK
ncbi:MAG: flagellar M-ring protein FliF [Gemmatimonadetes bacterium]|nr:flagellar M-ring protein FliF [Gemmatimonadota bacterium]